MCLVAQRPDDRNCVLRINPAHELCDLRVDDLFRLFYRLAPAFDIIVDDAFQVVHRIQVNILQFAHLGFHIPRHGNVQDKHGFVHAFQDCGLDRVFAQQWPAAGSGGDDDVRFVQVPGDFIQRDGVSGILLPQFLRSFQGTVGDDHLVQAAVVQVFCDKFYRFTGADQ